MFDEYTFLEFFRQQHHIVLRNTNAEDSHYLPLEDYYLLECLTCSKKQGKLLLTKKPTVQESSMLRPWIRSHRDTKCFWRNLTDEDIDKISTFRNLVSLTL